MLSLSGKSTLTALDQLVASSLELNTGLLRLRTDRPITKSGGDRGYFNKLTDGARRDRLQVAELFGVHKEDVSRFLPLAFLSPQLVEAIMHGRQPVDLSIRDLIRGMDLPLSWSAQADLIARTAPQFKEQSRSRLPGMCAV